MRIAIGIGAFIGGLLAVLILLLMFRAFDQDVALVLGAADGKNIDVLSAVILPLVSTFFGAAAGSYYTYKLQVVTKRAEQESNEVTLVRQVYLALESQLIDLGGLKRAIVIPFASETLRFLDMPVAIGHTGVSERINHDVSLPLIRYHSVDTLQKVRLAEKSYLNVVEIYKSYHELSASYKKALRDGGIHMNDICSLRFKASVAGGEAIAQMYVVGEALIEMLDSAIFDIDEVLDGLTEFYKNNYKSTENRMLRSQRIDSEDKVFIKSAPPYFADLNELMDACGYEPKYFDPLTNDPKPLRKLAQTNWERSEYPKPLRFRILFYSASASGNQALD
jgi:hypothetical protein